MDLTYVLSRRIVDNLYEGIRFIDLSNRQTTYWNKGAEIITGYLKDEVAGKACSGINPFHFDEQGKCLCDPCAFLDTVSRGNNCEKLVYLKNRKGALIPVHTCMEPIRDHQGNVAGAVEMFSDISWKFAALSRIDELNRLSLLDPLTRAGNRRFAEITITAKLEELKRYGISFGVLFIDVDDFKRVNDLYGHHHGDELLRKITQAMTRCLRVFDSICRWGGDEFIAIVSNIHHPDQLINLCRRLCFLAERSSLVIGGDSASATISIGATIAKFDDTTESLLARADEYMYQSKVSGKNLFCVR